MTVNKIKQYLLKRFKKDPSDKIDRSIKKETPLSDGKDAWIFESAQAFADARIYGDARVYGYAQLYTDVQVFTDKPNSEDIFVT